MSSRANTKNNCGSTKALQRGVTLIELMIALVLGLVIVGAVLNAFLASQQTFRLNENLAKMQEEARIGFELMARDIRETGSMPCGAFSSQIANVIRDGGSIPWWANWWAEGSALRGFDGSEAAANTEEISAATSIVAIGTGQNQRVTGTDSLITIQTAENGSAIVSHDAPGNQMTVADVSGFDEADVVVACDMQGASIFQIGAVSNSSDIIDYSTAIASNNCTNNLGTPISANCTTTSNRTFSATANAQVVKLVSNYWFIGNNSRGGRSLFKLSMINKTVAGAKQWVSETHEIIPNVTNMQIQYLAADTANNNVLATDWVSADDSTTFPFPPSGSAQVRYWSEQNNAKQIAAVRVQLTVQTEESISVTSTPIVRTLNFIIAIRSRNYLY